MGPKESQHGCVPSSDLEKNRCLRSAPFAVFTSSQKLLNASTEQNAFVCEEAIVGWIILN